MEDKEKEILARIIKKLKTLSKILETKN